MVELVRRTEQASSCVLASNEIGSLGAVQGIRLPRNRLSTAAGAQPYSATFRSHATAHRQTPKRPSKPPEGTVGAAPLSKSVTAVGLLDCGSASDSCLDGGTACGLV
jgi:hypothetical protein